MNKSKVAVVTIILSLVVSALLLNGSAISSDAVDPPSKLSGVGNGSNITVTFDESINNNRIYITLSNGNGIPGEPITVKLHGNNVGSMPHPGNSAFAVSGVSGIITGPGSYTVTVEKNSGAVSCVLVVTLKHLIRFEVDGVEKKSSYVVDGGNPTPPSTPTKAHTATVQYAFSGWSPALAQAFGPRTYTALFTETPYVPPTTPPSTPGATNYTITLNPGGGSISDSSWTASGNNYTKRFASGAALTLPQPTLDGKIFDGWNQTPSETVTGNATYTAQWKDAPANFTVTGRVAGDGGNIGGTISAPRYTESGGDVTFTFSADPGLKFDRVVTDAKNYKVSGNEIRFSNVTSDIDFELVFATATEDNHWIYIIAASILAAIFAIATLWLLSAAKRRKAEEERS
jgi:hypothetical protein